MLPPVGTRRLEIGKSRLNVAKTWLTLTKKKSSLFWEKIAKSTILW
jgi:hypothetical protein